MLTHGWQATESMPSPIHIVPFFLNFFYFWKFGEWVRAFGRMDVQHPHFYKLFPKLGSVKCSIPHGDWRFDFFSNFVFLNLEYTWTFISTVGIFVSWKIEITKNSSRFARFFVFFFSVGCIWVCSTHHLPLRFGTQVPNMMCITMEQKLKVA
jgi:hypothetical protein